MTVVFRAKDKELDDESAFLETIKLRCALYNLSYVIADELNPAWAPDGCKRTESVLLEAFLDDPASTGWVAHDRYLLCASCERRWQLKFGDAAILELMSGAI